MQSVAQDHFPQYVFRDGTKLLWNPVLKKSFVDRPEERVRLQIVDYLILEAGFSASRISFESPVNLPRDKSASRTDIICFDKDFKPFLLAECKAPEIALNEKASVQIARYNQKVKAPFLLITNGLEDLWFDTQSDSVSSLSHIPEKFNARSTVKRDFEYWNKEGLPETKHIRQLENGCWKVASSYMALKEIHCQSILSSKVPRKNYFCPTITASLILRAL